MDVRMPDGTIIRGVPEGTTKAQLQAKYAAHLQGATPAPAPQQAPEENPRWDIVGDIGKAARSAYGALKSDITNALPSDEQRQVDRNNYDGSLSGFARSQADLAGRVGGLAKAPLDALGLVASPITGALHGIAGSALSYVLPTPAKDTVVGGTTLYSDPKKAADQIIDTSLMGLGPKRGGAPVEFGTNAEVTANRADRAAAKTQNRAIDKVNVRAKGDELTPEQVAEAQRIAAAGGDKVTLMDLGNKNVRGLAGAVHRAPGEAGKQLQDFLDTRDAAATHGLTQDIHGTIANGSTYGAGQDLLNARSAAARPAYAAAESIGPIHSDRLQRFLDTPEIQAGLRRGLKLERQNAIAEDRPFVDSEYAVTGYKDGNFDQPIFGKVPTMKSMMVANEGLGAQIADMVNPATGRLTKDGLALKKFRDAFQGELDSLSGGKYAVARDTWSGPAQSMEAIQDGRQHFTRADSNEQLKAEFDKLSPGDKDFYRMGAAEAKVDAMERAPDASDKSKRVINSDRDRKRFSMLFDSPAQAQNFIDAVARKRQAFDTKNTVMGNSATAGRQIEDADNGNFDLLLNGARGMGNLGAGNLLGAAKAFYDTKTTLGMRNNPALNSEIAKILMDPKLTVGGDTGGLIPSVRIPPKKHSAATTALVNALLSAPRPSPEPKR